MKSGQHTHLSDYLLESVVHKNVGLYGMGLTKCSTVDDLVSLLDDKTILIPKPRYLDGKRMHGPDQMYLKYILGEANGNVASMVNKFHNAINPQLNHYDIFIVKPKENIGYSISLYDIPSEGKKKIRWNVKGGTSVAVYNLDDMSCTIELDNFSNAKEKLNIFDKI